ncbi:MAG: isochorismatase family cysteine hydrolase [Methanobacteriota archaeon]
MPKVTVNSEPRDFELNPEAAALVIIDMQNDFVKPGGLGYLKGYDVSLLERVVEPIKKTLDAARSAGIKVIYTRQGYRPDLSDFPFSGRTRDQRGDIGTVGFMGRILVRGHTGHEIIDELKPLESEVIIDKHGHGAFYATDLEVVLKNWGIKHLIITGVTTEMCVNSTVREADDRGYQCLVLEDCVASYNQEFHKIGLKMISGQGGLLGRVATSENFVNAIHGLK